MSQRSMSIFTMSLVLCWPQSGVHKCISWNVHAIKFQCGLFLQLGKRMSVSNEESTWLKVSKIMKVEAGQSSQDKLESCNAKGGWSWKVCGLTWHCHAHQYKIPEGCNLLTVEFILLIWHLQPNSPASSSFTSHSSYPIQISPTCLQV